jgi:phenylpropionate dioxygenase-like ring-hydroxylating dioxygenase large terminal subunit
MSEFELRDTNPAVAVVGNALKRTDEVSYDRAWSMPSGFYTDPAVLALERDRLFLQEWICLGRVDELPMPGDYLTTDICGEPVLAVRGTDGTLRAFSNVCRHRGMPIARGKGNNKAFMCPYHHWSYDTTGRLIAAPRMPVRPDFDTANCRLPQFAVEEWLGFLFVCLADAPPPLASRLAGLEKMVRPYHLEMTSLRYVDEQVWQTNWKSLLENFMEGYHISSLHHDSLHTVNPTRLCKHFPPGEAYFGYLAGFSNDFPRTQKGHPSLTESEIDNCVMFAVPPGFAVGCSADQSSFISIQPEAIDRVRVKTGLMFYGEDWPQSLVDWNIEFFERTMAEDKTALVDLFRGMRSRHYRSGPLAPADYEGPIWDFYRYMRRTLGPALESM